MDGANGTALEWALALLRSPAERYRLRQRPLPPGVDALLAIAANAAPDALDSEGARLRESAETLREAARFYAREVLFHAEADAYRSLGVAPQATTEQIKIHHRLLQAWLHPDREQSGDDSVFAARINTAWNQLRSPDRRAAYDAGLAGIRASAQVEPVEAAGMAATPAQLWQAPAPVLPAMGRRRHRLLVFGLLGACLLLGWLALRESERVPEPWSMRGAEVAAPDQSASAPTLPEATQAMGRAPARSAVSPARAAPVPAPTLAPPQPQPQPALIDVPMAADTDAPQAIRAPSPEPIAPSTIARTRLPAVAESSRSVDLGQRRQRPKPGHSAVPSAAAAPGATMAQRPASPEPAAVPVAQAPQIAQRAAAAGTATLVAENSPAASRDSLFGRLRQAFGRRSHTRATPDLGVEGDVAFERIQQARQVGQQLLRYLASANRTPPPIWDSAATLDRADGLRNGLHHAGSPRLGAPHWRIGKTSAVLTSDYRIGGAVQGTLTAAVVWREDRWLVTSVALETAP
ncbi:MAG: J domain-containing protein [Thermomonas sp.]|uniref:J domain-containing protein n=1 Tax=Thermomonas sp. TaxID=1971895 RepID=UPI001D1AC9C3|nr:DnaJ domain-containing protein [Thermomonas sp.]MBZ0087629.1 J domain-containing protein [Thermomonas sp.]